MYVHILHMIFIKGDSDPDVFGHLVSHLSKIRVEGVSVLGGNTNSKKMKKKHRMMPLSPFFAFRLSPFTIPLTRIMLMIKNS